MYNVDPREYDLFYDNINLCKSDWDFSVDPGVIAYRFQMKSWLNRRKGLWALKQKKIRLPYSLSREMIMFI